MGQLVARQDDVVAHECVDPREQRSRSATNDAQSGPCSPLKYIVEDVGICLVINLDSVGMWCWASDSRTVIVLTISTDGLHDGDLFQRFEYQ